MTRDEIDREFRADIETAMATYQRRIQDAMLRRARLNPDYEPRRSIELNDVERALEDHLAAYTRLAQGLAEITERVLRSETAASSAADRFCELEARVSALEAPPARSAPDEDDEPSIAGSIRIPISVWEAILAVRHSAIDALNEPSGESREQLRRAMMAWTDAENPNR